jgi:hypothetical protein
LSVADIGDHTIEWKLTVPPAALSERSITWIRRVAASGWSCGSVLVRMVLVRLSIVACAQLASWVHMPWTSTTSTWREFPWLTAPAIPGKGALSLTTTGVL